MYLIVGVILPLDAYFLAKIFTRLLAKIQNNFAFYQSKPCNTRYSRLITRPINSEIPPTPHQSFGINRPFVGFSLPRQKLLYREGSIKKRATSALVLSDHFPPGIPRVANGSTFVFPSPSLPLLLLLMTGAEEFLREGNSSDALN